MSSGLSERARWAIVIAFAIAMAWVEAARVYSSAAPSRS
jgi:hypothetical protein